MAVPRWIVASAAAGLLALGTAACASDSDTVSQESPAAVDPVTGGPAAPAPATDPALPATVVDVAAGNAAFSTLVEAVKAADLVGTLSGPGPFTVFAPTNDAFKALPQGTLESLLRPENKSQLASVLTYHVVPGKVLSSDLRDGMRAKTVQGQNLTIGVGGGGVTVTDASGNTVKVVQADVQAGNGVVHAIDGVLLPSSA